MFVLWGSIILDFSPGLTSATRLEYLFRRPLKVKQPVVKWAGKTRREKHGARWRVISKERKNVPKDKRMEFTKATY